MEKIFDMDNPFWRGFMKIIDIAYISVIWLAFSLPVVTIGASTTALYYVCLKLAANEEGYIFRGFWKSFKQNFRQATVIWVIIGALIAFFCFDLKFLMGNEVKFDSVMKGVYLGALLLVVLLGIYVFAVLSRFDNTTKNTFLNAGLMAARHFPSTICMAAIIGSVVMFGLIVFPPLLLVAPGIIGYLNALLFNRIFKQYMPKEEPISPDGESLAEKEEA